MRFLSLCVVIWENPSHSAKLLFLSCESLNYSLSRTFFPWTSSDTAVKSYWCSKATKNKEKHQNYDVNFLYFAVSPFARCDRLSQITSHMDPTYQSMISSPGCTSTMQQILGNLWFHLCNIRKRGKHIYLLKTLLDSWNENLIKMENVVF